MADLDDFFAKKDRKKKPTKKFVTPEDLTKKLEITTPKVADTKPKKEQPQKPSNPSDNDAENDQNAVTEVCTLSSDLHFLACFFFHVRIE